MKQEIELQKTYWASVSGGKDSLYMLAHILHNIDRYPLDGVVHFELEIDYPFIKNVIDYMESECKKYNVPFLRIKPRITWVELYTKYGFPTRVARWCNSKYKLDCCKQLDDIMKQQNKKVIHYIGYCANEVSRAENHSKKSEDIYPLVELGVYEETIWKWAKNQPIFNDYYKYNKRCGCMYCPMQSMQNTKYLSVFYPKQYEKMLELAEDTEIMREYELGRAFSVWGAPKYNTEYRRKRMEQIELKELERW